MFSIHVARHRYEVGGGGERRYRTQDYKFEIEIKERC